MEKVEFVVERLIVTRDLPSNGVDPVQESLSVIAEHSDPARRAAERQLLDCYQEMLAKDNQDVRQLLERMAGGGPVTIIWDDGKPHREYVS